MRKNRFEPQEATRAKPARERVFMLSIGRKLHDVIVSGQSIESLYKSDVSLNFVRQDVISGLWFSEKLKVTTLSKLRPICLLVNHWCKVPFWRHTLFYSVLCLLITLPCSPKAELRRAQLNGIGLWFSEKLKVTTLSKLRPICLLVNHWCKVPFWRHTLFYSVLCLLITLPCSPKAELRRAQLNGIGRMHVRGACGCCETAMN